MRILHIVPSYLPAWGYGGPIWSVHTMNKWLVKFGIDVTVYTTNIDKKGTLDVPLEREMDVDGVKVFYFPISFRPWQYSSTMRKALKKNIKNFDMVHITSVFLSVSTLGAYYAKKNKKPYIISPRGSLMKEPLEMKSTFLKKIYISIIEKRNLRNASAIHFTIEKERKEYLEADLPLKNSFIIPNSHDSSEFEGVKKDRKFLKERFLIPEDKKVILSIGRINWKKGFDTLIPAFAGAVKKEPNTVLVIAGEDDGGEKKKIEALAEKLGVAGKIIFTGLVKDQERIKLIASSDVFALSSYSENFGMVVVEAMSAGVPVVVSDAVGVSKWVKEYNAGIVVKKDVNEVSSAIEEVLLHFEKAGEMGKNGKKSVKREFSPDKVAEKFIEEYKKTIEKN